MIRTFHEWWETLPLDIKDKNYQNDDLPRLSHVNFIWITDLMNNSSEEMNPTVAELLEWVKTGQINAINNS